MIGHHPDETQLLDLFSKASEKWPSSALSNSLQAASVDKSIGRERDDPLKSSTRRTDTYCVLPSHCLPSQDLEQVVVVISTVVTEVRVVVVEVVPVVVVVVVVVVAILPPRHLSTWPNRKTPVKSMHDALMCHWTIFLKL